MTTDPVLAADAQACAAARLRGATQALNVFDRRSPDEQERACAFAMALLAAGAEAADWTLAGLPQPPPGQPGGPRRYQPEVLVPVSHHSVLLLARTAMNLHIAGTRGNQRPALWARLARFFSESLPASHPEMVRLRERALNARRETADTAPPVFDGLRWVLDYHRRQHGEGAYLTSIARTNLALAYRHRRGETDLAMVTSLAQDEVRARTARYGPHHSVTLMARSVFAQALLLQAEESSDEQERRQLARRALTEVTDIRAARDRLFGATSPNAAVSRRHEARALLLLGEAALARTSLELTLAFETAHNSGCETQTIAYTHYQLAKANRDLGDRDRARAHALAAVRIFTLHSPGSRDARLSASLLAELGCQHERGPQPARQAGAAEFVPGLPVNSPRGKPVSAPSGPAAAFRCGILDP